MATGVPIGAAAHLSGLKVPTIRYYEEVGLLSRPARTAGNRRLYDEGLLKRLTFIRHARELGFGIDAIRILLDLQDTPGQPCSPADSIARVQLSAVRARIAKLQALERELEHMIDRCSHGTVAECHVIEVLADHERCENENH